MPRAQGGGDGNVAHPLVAAGRPPLTPRPRAGNDSRHRLPTLPTPGLHSRQRSSAGPSTGASRRLAAGQAETLAAAFPVPYGDPEKPCAAPVAHSRAKTAAQRRHLPRPRPLPAPPAASPRSLLRPRRAAAGQCRAAAGQRRGADLATLAAPPAFRHTPRAAAQRRAGCGRHLGCAEWVGSALQSEGPGPFSDTHPAVVGECRGARLGRDL